MIFGLEVPGIALLEAEGCARGLPEMASQGPVVLF